MGEENRTGSREVETERVNNSLGEAEKRNEVEAGRMTWGKGGSPLGLLSPVCRLTGIIRW